MSSIQSQFLDFTEHHAKYDAIDPQSALKQSATGKVIYIAGASRGIAEEIQTDGQLGACVDVAQMLNKILEELGIWSYSVQGALTFDASSLPNPTHFWMFDDKPVPGHVWVVAPPFGIIDVTLRTQPGWRWFPHQRPVSALHRIMTCPERSDRR